MFIKMEAYAHSKNLLSRIEDQLLDKFNKQYPDQDNEILSVNPDDDYISSDKLAKVIENWINFWLMERPVTKFDTKNTVIAMKDHICKIRLKLLISNSYELEVFQYFPKHLQDILKRIEHS